MPRHVGQFFMIDSLLFEEESASFATPEVPYNLIVVELRGVRAHASLHRKGRCRPFSGVICSVRSSLI